MGDHANNRLELTFKQFWDSFKGFFGCKFDLKAPFEAYLPPSYPLEKTPGALEIALKPSSVLSMMLA